MSTGRGLLESKTVIVSGVGEGLGRQVALACGREGASLVLAARTAERMEAVAAEVRASGGTAMTVVTDITVLDQCRNLVSCALEELGHVHCLVNVAARGAFMPDAYTTLESANLGAWRETFDVNVFGTLQMTQSVIPAMKEAGGGSIVFVNTMGIWTKSERQGAYISSKAALLSASQVLAKEVGQYGIRVNSVAPGWMFGPPVKGLLSGMAERDGTSFEEQYAKVAADVPLGFIPTDADCAECVVFLASDLARAVTGHCLDANGGQVSR